MAGFSIVGLGTFTWTRDEKIFYDVKAAPFRDWSQLHRLTQAPHFPFRRVGDWEKIISKLCTKNLFFCRFRLGSPSHLPPFVPRNSRLREIADSRGRFHQTKKVALLPGNEATTDRVTLIETRDSYISVRTSRRVPVSSGFLRSDVSILC